MDNEIERIKKIVEDEIKNEIGMKRIKNVSRLKHIRDHIIFNIDNPNYVRKELRE